MVHSGHLVGVRYWACRTLLSATATVTAARSVSVTRPSVPPSFSNGSVLRASPFLRSLRRRSLLADGGGPRILCMSGVCSATAVADGIDQRMLARSTAPSTTTRAASGSSEGASAHATGRQPRHDPTAATPPARALRPRVPCKSVWIRSSSTLRRWRPWAESSAARVGPDLVSEGHQVRLDEIEPLMAIEHAPVCLLIDKGVLECRDRRSFTPPLQVEPLAFGKLTQSLLPCFLRFAHVFPRRVRSRPWKHSIRHIPRHVVGSVDHDLGHVSEGPF